MTVSVFNLYQQYKDASGNVLSGGTLTFYEAGTTTPKTVYTTQAATVAQSNPYTLDASGRTVGDVWLTDDGLYDILIKDSTGATVRTDEDVGEDNSGSTPTTVSEVKNRVVNPAMTVDNGTAASITTSYAEYAVVDWLAKTSASPSAGTATVSTSAPLASSSRYAYHVSGLTVPSGTVSIAQNMLRENFQDLVITSANSTFSCQVYHDAGVSLDYTIKIYSANAANNFSAVTLRSTSSTQSVDSATKTQITHTVDLSTITDADNGIRFEIECSCGAVTTKNFYWSEAQLNKGSAAATFTMPTHEVQQAALNLDTHDHTDFGAQIPTDGIAASAITTSKINDLAVTNGKLAANSVTADKIGAGAVGTSELDSLAVTEGKINGGAVTVNKIGAGAVTPVKTSFIDNPTGIYIGQYNGSTDTDVELPSGWSTTKNGTGDYTITHNLGTANYTKFIDIIQTGTFIGVATSSQTTNSFSVITAGAVDRTINYMVVTW